MNICFRKMFNFSNSRCNFSNIIAKYCEQQPHASNKLSTQKPLHCDRPHSMLRYAFFVIRHRVYSWLSSTAARQSQQQRTASTSLILQDQHTTASNNSHSTAHSCTYSAGMVRPIVISGPSGGGKSTILTKVMEEYPDTFAFSVSHTTRKPRPGEHEGIHYHFVERPHMEQMIQAGEFFEHAQFGGNIYGTSKKAVEEVRASGKICVLDVELQGVHNFKRAGFDAKYILIQPPSIEVLKSRLEQRGTENTDSMQKRLKHAQEDMEAVAKEPHLFDKVVINDNFERAYMDFLKAIRPELDEFHKQQAANPGKCCAASGVDLTMPKTAPIIEDGIGVDAN